MACAVEFTISESAMHSRENWGVFQVFCLTKRTKSMLEGTFPVRAEEIVPGQTFQALYTNSTFRDKPRMKATAITPRDSEAFAVVQQIAGAHTNLKQSCAGALKKMSAAEFALALRDGAPTSAKDDPLVAIGRLKPATAARIRVLYSKSAATIELQTNYPMLPAQHLHALTPEQCSACLSNPYEICRAFEGKLSRPAALRIADQMACAKALSPYLPERLARHLEMAIEVLCDLRGSFWVTEDSLLQKACETLMSSTRLAESATMRGRVLELIKGEAEAYSVCRRTRTGRGVRERRMEQHRADRSPSHRLHPSGRGARHPEALLPRQ